MTVRSRPLADDTLLAAAAAATVGICVVLALSSALGGAVPLAIGSAGVAAFALALLITAGWIDPILLIVIAVPLPALISNDAIRVAAVAPVTALAIFAWYLHRAWRKAHIETRGLPMRVLILLACILLLTSLTATEVGTALRETTNLIVLAAFLVAAFDTFQRKPAAADQCALLFALLAALCGALAVLQSVGVLPSSFPRWGTSFFRASLGFGQPNALGLFLAMAVPFVVHRLSAARAEQRLLWLTALGSTIAGLAATFSRGSWLALLLGAFALLLTGERRFVLRVLAGAVVALLLFELSSGGALSDTVRRTANDWIVEQRIAMVLAGIAMFVQHPLTGVGPGGYAINLTSVGTEIPELWDYLPTPHNAFVQMAAETGVLGLIAFVLLLLVTLRACLRGVRANPGNTIQRAVLWSFGCFVCSCMVVWPFSHGTGQMVMLVIALAFATTRTAAS